MQTRHRLAVRALQCDGRGAWSVDCADSRRGGDCRFCARHRLRGHEVGLASTGRRRRREVRAQDRRLRLHLEFLCQPGHAAAPRPPARVRQLPHRAAFGRAQAGGRAAEARRERRVVASHGSGPRRRVQAREAAETPCGGTLGHVRGCAECHGHGDASGLAFVRVCACGRACVPASPCVCARARGECPTVLRCSASSRPGGCRIQLAR
mmetsp:Transcript_101446/g.302577  ORF Transcript_101446/g.302577 Transcript_101446/m.302577 type:complete len:208 (+) Transcript_101446:651-1274(+)